MTSYKDSPANPCHHHVLPRMNRIAGQVTGIKSMIEEHRYIDAAQSRALCSARGRS